MPLLKSPQPETEKAKTEEQGELSAAEDFSDIGESDEEILNQDNHEEMPEAEIEEANNEHETVISSQVVVFKLSCIYNNTYSRPLAKICEELGQPSIDFGRSHCWYKELGNREKSLTLI